MLKWNPTVMLLVFCSLINGKCFTCYPTAFMTSKTYLRVLLKVFYGIGVPLLIVMLPCRMSSWSFLCSADLPNICFHLLLEQWYYMEIVLPITTWISWTSEFLYSESRCLQIIIIINYTEGKWLACRSKDKLLWHTQKTLSLSFTFYLDLMFVCVWRAPTKLPKCLYS